MSEIPIEATESIEPDGEHIPAYDIEEPFSPRFSPIAPGATAAPLMIQVDGRAAAGFESPDVLADDLADSIDAAFAHNLEAVCVLAVEEHDRPAGPDGSPDVTVLLDLHVPPGTPAAIAAHDQLISWYCTAGKIVSVINKAFGYHVVARSGVRAPENITSDFAGTHFAGRARQGLEAHEGESSDEDGSENEAE